jgi:Fe-S oxidoreductase
MFKEPEPGRKDINIERTEEVLETQPDYVAAACPFCNTMLSDGVKNSEREGQLPVLDLAEMIAEAQDL